jgi:outer membrane lipoprotein SlyB
MTRRIKAMLTTAILASGCAAQTAQDLQEASTGRITKIVPVVIESDTAPGVGSAFAKKTANRPGQRITVLTNNEKLIEVTQDEEQPGFRVGDSVRIEGFGIHAKIRRP